MSFDEPPTDEVIAPLVACEDGPEGPEDTLRADEPVPAQPNYAWAAYASVRSEPIGRVIR